MSQKKLYRTEGPDSKVFGVCGGNAEFFGKFLLRHTARAAQFV